MVSALNTLPAILAGTEEIEAAAGLGTGTIGPGFEVPTAVPRGAETGADVPASLLLRIAPIRTNVSPDAAANEKNRVGVTRQGNRTLRADSHQAAAVCTNAERRERKAT
jgi:hypothetical protein